MLPPLHFHTNISVYSYKFSNNEQCIEPMIFLLFLFNLILFVCYRRCICLQLLAFVIDLLVFHIQCSA